MHTRPINQQTVVITGASSGIGREAALRFARKGARVVAAARNVGALNTLVDEIRSNGGLAMAVPTDVTRWEDVEALAREAETQYGRIDTWINNAAVSIYARFEDTTPEEFKRVIDVILMGQVYGTMAALKTMGNRTDAMVIIEVASALAEHSVPLQSAYCAAKHGIKGFVESLRQELAHDGRNVAVCLVEPSSINTPLFEHARPKIGVQPQPLKPVYDPSIVADALLSLAVKPRAVLAVGGAGEMMSFLDDVAPPLLDRMFTRSGIEQQRTSRPADERDNLDAPIQEPGRVRGNFGGRRFSTYTWARLHPRAAATVAAGAAGAAMAAPALAAGLIRNRNGKHADEDHE